LVTDANFPCEAVEATPGSHLECVRFVVVAERGA
jgi:hypothetical protein